MPSINVAGAPDRFRQQTVLGGDGKTYGPGRNAPGECARWTYFAIGGIPNQTPLPTAIAAWTNAPVSHRHPIIDGVTRIPRGAVIVLGKLNSPRWSGDKTFADGDVFVADGVGVGFDNEGPCTDSTSGLGVIATMTVRQRSAETGRPVLGYLSSYGGWDLEFGTTSTASTGTTTALKEDTLAAPTLVTYTDRKRFVGAADGNLFTFSNQASLETWSNNHPVTVVVAADTLTKLANLAQKANTK